MFVRASQCKISAIFQAGQRKEILFHRETVAFVPFQKTLFSAESTQTVESFSHDKLNQKVLSAFVLLPPPHQVLEYLIRIYVYNVEDVMISILPFHKTGVSVRIVQLLKLEWEFLKEVKKSGAAPPHEDAPMTMLSWKLSMIYDTASVVTIPHVLMTDSQVGGLMIIGLLTGKAALTTNLCSSLLEIESLVTLVTGNCSRELAGANAHLAASTPSLGKLKHIETDIIDYLLEINVEHNSVLHSGKKQMRTLLEALSAFRLQDVIQPLCGLLALNLLSSDLYNGLESSFQLLRTIQMFICPGCPSATVICSRGLLKPLFELLRVHLNGRWPKCETTVVDCNRSIYRDFARCSTTPSDDLVNVSEGFINFVSEPRKKVFQSYVSRDAARKKRSAATGDPEAHMKIVTQISKLLEKQDLSFHKRLYQPC
ncbi:hypothetical protein SELMODRAFT_405123 [Selaginella moellendorffii]|uniref:Uncharacterized protein n=1 Tax=Selaginella moellendorffii TaxID=88036 RepID=D8QYG9_SELML|nr:hypothetical protein SELMODRAFT_405123 [Selaginella moellendorffii]